MPHAAVDGRGHAHQNAHQRTPGAPAGMCKHCGCRRTNDKFDYCGRTCGTRAQEEAKRRGLKMPPQGSTSNEKVSMCSYCHARPRYREVHKSSGRVTEHEYCGRSCARDAGIRSAGQHGGSAHGKAADQSVTLKELNLDQREGAKCREHFVDRWGSSNHQHGRPAVRAAYEIRMPSEIENASKRSLPEPGQATVTSTYFGAECLCDIGAPDQNSLSPCDKGGCIVCTVLRFGFFAPQSTKALRNGRHGRGIYTSTDPSRAHRFTTDHSSHPYRVIVACRVVVSSVSGQSKLATCDETGRVFCPPNGPILPSHLIIYEIKD